MIINTASITNNGSSLNISIEAGEGYLITSGRLWTETTFKDYNLARDLSFKFENINNTETFILSATEAGLSSFNGIYFLEFETNEPDTDECTTCSNPTLIVVTNLNQYYRCMTELILKADFCTDNLFSAEVCNDSNVNKALSINLLIEAVNQALEIGQFIEAIGLVTKIQRLCSKCSNCRTIVKTPTCNSCNSYTF